MGGELVSESPDQPQGRVDILMEQCGYYLAMGMPSQEYWDGPCWLVRCYRDATRVLREVKNRDDWRLGGYLYAALVRVAPLYDVMGKNRKPMPYLTEPFPLSEREAETQKEQRDLQNGLNFMEQFAIEFNAKFEKGVL